MLFALKLDGLEVHEVLILHLDPLPLEDHKLRRLLFIENQSFAHQYCKELLFAADTD